MGKIYIYSVTYAAPDGSQQVNLSYRGVNDLPDRYVNVGDFTVDGTGNFVPAPVVITTPGTGPYYVRVILLCNGCAFEELMWAGEAVPTTVVPTTVPPQASTSTTAPATTTIPPFTTTTRPPFTTTTRPPFTTTRPATTTTTVPATTTTTTIPVGPDMCGDSLTNTTSDNNLHFYPDIPLTFGMSGVLTVNLLWDAVGRPNRFNVYVNGSLLIDTNWVGVASYTGPWGPSLGGPVTGVLTFSYIPGNNYFLRVEAGPGDPITPTSDTWNVNINCGG